MALSEAEGNRVAEIGELDENDKEYILEVLQEEGFEPISLLQIEDDKLDLRETMWNRLFETENNIIKPLYSDDHDGWPVEGYTWDNNETKDSVSLEEDNKSLKLLLMDTELSNDKIEILFTRCSWLNVHGTQHSLIDIGIEALRTADFGGFDDGEIEIIMHVCPELSAITSFPHKLNHNSIILDPKNYRISENIEGKTVHGEQSILQYIIDTGVSGLYDPEVQRSVLESITAKTGPKEEYRIQELVNSITQNGFSPEFPLAVIPIEPEGTWTSWTSGSLTAEIEGELNARQDPKVAGENELKFLVVDGNRRWTALSRISKRLQGESYNNKPKLKEKMKIVLETVPVIVKPARDYEDLKSIRLNTQTMHHQVGQLAWNPFAKALNIKQSYDHLEGSHKSRRQAMSLKWGMEGPEIKKTIRALNILEKCVEAELVDGSKKSDRYGGFKTLIDNYKWSKWFGLPSEGLWSVDAFIEDANYEKARTVFEIMETEGYSERTGTFNADKWKNMVKTENGTRALDRLIANGDFTPDNASDEHRILQDNEGGREFLNVLKGLENEFVYNDLTDLEKENLMEEDSELSTTNLTFYRKTEAFNTELNAARTIHQEEIESKFPEWLEAYLQGDKDRSQYINLIKTNGLEILSDDFDDSDLGPMGKHMRETLLEQKE